MDQRPEQAPHAAAQVGMGPLMHSEMCMLGCRQQRVDNDGQKHSNGGADLPRFSANSYTFSTCGTSKEVLLVLVRLIVCLPLRTLVPCLSYGAPSSLIGLRCSLDA